MSQMKSAWEIALEKTSKLGKISEEELKKQEEEKYNQIGQALADKIFAGLSIEQLVIEMDKFNQKERPSISKSLASHLVNSIDLDDMTKFGKILDALYKVNIIKFNQEIVQKYRALSEEYKKAIADKSAEIERRQRDILHRLRISGTAVGEVNIKADAEGQQALEQIASPFQKQLNELKQQLITGQ